MKIKEKRITKNISTHDYIIKKSNEIYEIRDAEFLKNYK